MCPQGEGSHFARCSLPLALSGRGVGWAPLPWAGGHCLRGSLKVLHSSGEQPQSLLHWGSAGAGSSILCPWLAFLSLLHGSSDQTWPEASPLSLSCFLENVFYLRAGACAAGCFQGTERIWPRFPKQLACHGSWSRTWVCVSTGKHFRVGVALCHPSLAQTERRESG